MEYPKTVLLLRIIIKDTHFLLSVHILLPFEIPIAINIYFSKLILQVNLDMTDHCKTDFRI